MIKDKYGIIRMLAKSPRRSIGTRMLLLFVVVVSLLVAAVGLLSYGMAAKSLIGQAEASSRQTIALAGEKLDMKQRFYQNLSNQLINNSRFTDHLFQITIPDLSTGERERRQADIRDMLGQLVLSDAAIRDISLIPLEDDIGPVTTAGQDVRAASDEAWIEGIRGREDASGWLPVKDNGYLGTSPKPLIAYGKVLGKHNIGSRDFLLLIQVDAAILDEMIQSVRLSPGGETGVLDASGFPMASNGRTDLFEAVELPSGAEAGSINDDEKRLLYAYRVSPLTGWTIIGTAPIKELTGAADNIRRLAYEVIAGSIAVAAVVGMILVIAIGRPLGELESLMAQAASGDFRGRMRRKRQDEIGRVTDAYNKMAQQIGELVAGTRRLVDELALSSSQLSIAAAETALSAEEVRQAMGQISQGAVGLSGISDEGALQVERMGDRLTEAIGLQARMADAARESDDASRRGAAATGGLLRKTNDAELRFRVVSERIDGLNDGAHSIRGLLQLMTDMAKRIKILSLNASIEAARAGTSGAGFKVIADEIRNLAEQSGDSIGRVASLTDSIQNEVTGSVTAVRESLPLFVEMVDEVRTVSRVMDDVLARTEHVISYSAQVTASLEQMRETQQTMAVSIEEVSSVAQESSASTEQVASLCANQADVGNRLVELSNSLQSVSAVLEEQMNRFRVG